MEDATEAASATGVMEVADDEETVTDPGQGWSETDPLWQAREQTEIAAAESPANIAAGEPTTVKLESSETDAVCQPRGQGDITAVIGEEGHGTVKEEISLEGEQFGDEDDFPCRSASSSPDFVGFTREDEYR